jgi:hypothetical protein
MKDKGSAIIAAPNGVSGSGIAASGITAASAIRSSRTPATTPSMASTCRRRKRNENTLADRAAVGDERRYCPPEVSSTEVVPVVGRPGPERICTSIVGRQNLSVRMGTRRFTRLTNAFSKSARTIGRLYRFGSHSTTSAAFTNPFADRLQWKRRSRTTFGPCVNCWRQHDSSR